MSCFTEFSAPLQVQYDASASRILGADHWRVCQPFRFYLGGRDTDRWVYVPAGYLTDGASVPRAFWSMIPPWGSYGQAAVAHDIVCEYLSITVDGQPVRVTRRQCDEILLEAMTVLGVPIMLRQAIYAGVSLYRGIAAPDRPTTTPKKRRLESDWRS